MTVLAAGERGLLGVLDWPRVAACYEDFWHRRNTRPVCYVATEGGVLDDRPSLTLDQLYHDVGSQVRRFRERIGSTIYQMQGFPFLKPRTGYAAWGGPAVFAEDTIWIEPCITDWSKGEWRFDPGNPYFQEVLEHLGALAADARGEYHVAMPSLLPPLDILSCKRGPEQLCIDLLTEPERVRDAQVELTESFACMMRTLWEVLPEGNGYSGWYVCWSSRPYYTLQCDFSAMLSPALFERFVVPEIVALSKLMDRCMYHLDGPDAVRHLDTLLQMPEIDVVQWTPGAGDRNSISHWIPMLHRIQAANKGLCVQARFEEMEIIERELDPEGLFVWVLGAAQPETGGQP